MDFCSVQDAVDTLISENFVIIASSEGQGHLMMASAQIRPDAVNFMSRRAGGLVRVGMAPDMLDRLELPMMGRPDMGFTIPVNARQGITTGGSAADRSRTIQVLTDTESRPADLVSPGCIFPLRARAGGVLSRRGVAEAGVDLARLAGLTPSTVLCEIMSEDGSMAAIPELSVFGQEYGIPMISVNTVGDYFESRNISPLQRQSPGIIRSAETTIPTDYGRFKAIAYRDLETNEEHLAMCMGPIDRGTPLVRMHSACLTGDVFGSKRCDCGEQLGLAMKRIQREGAGVLLYLNQEGRGIGLCNKIRAYALQDQGLDTVEANVALGFPADLRSYRGAAWILKDLCVNTLRLMTNNPRKIEGLEKHGLDVVRRVSHELSPGKDNCHYLKTKATKLSHMLTLSA